MCEHIYTELHAQQLHISKPLLTQIEFTSIPLRLHVYICISKKLRVSPKPPAHGMGMDPAVALGYSCCVWCVNV